MQVRDVMTKDLVTVTPSTSLREAMALLQRNRVSGLPVVREGRLVGIVTEGDIVKRARQELPWYAYVTSPMDVVPLPDFPLETWSERARHLMGQPVSTVMTRKVVVADPTMDLAEVAGLLTGRHVKRLPVMDGDRLVGVISRGDVVKGLLLSVPA